jgi:hypothetical protein
MGVLVTEDVTKLDMLFEMTVNDFFIFLLTSGAVDPYCTSYL